MRASTSDNATTPDPPRFPYGLVLDTAKVLEAYGHGPFEGGQLMELGQHLWHFLHGREGSRCYGQPAATVEPTTPSTPGDEAPAADEAHARIDRAIVEHRAEIDRKITAVRRGSAALDAAAERWGLGR